MSEDKSILNRMARDAATLVVLAGVFWFLRKAVSIALMLFGLALVAVNQSLIFLIRPLVRQARRWRQERNKALQVVPVTELLWVDSEVVTYVPPKQKYFPR